MSKNRELYLSDRVKIYATFLIILFAVPAILLASIYLSGHEIPAFIAVRSSGTYWPALQLKYLAISIAASAIAAFAMFRWGGIKASPDMPTPHKRAEVAAIVVLTALLVYGFSYPPTFIGANFRILWVDPLFGKTPVIPTLYFVPTLLKSWYIELFGPENTPHFVFLSMLAAALLFMDCCRLIGLGGWTRLSATVSFVASAQMLIFYQPNEDVTLITAFGLACVNAFLRRNALATGLAFAVLLLSRPTFAFLPAAIMFADVVDRFLHREGGTAERFWNATVRNHYALVASILAIAIVAAIHVYWYATGVHMLQVGNLEYEPIERFGFTISSWSWVYTAHYLWAVPSLITGAAVAALVVPNGDRRLALLAIFLLVTYLLLLDGRAGKMYYYNVRYMLYVFPFVLLAAWSLVAHTRGITHVVMAACIVLASMFGAHVSVADITKHPRLGKLQEVYDDRAILRRTVGDRDVLLDRGTCRNPAYNMISALLVRRINYVHLPDLERRQPGILVMCEDPAEPPSGYAFAFRSGGLTFLERE